MPDEFFAAIERDISERVILFRQAIAYRTSGNISHYEVLCRVKKDGTIVAPMPLIAALEQHKYTGYLDRFVIAETIDYLARSHDTAKHSVNLSGETINKNGEFIKFLNGLKHRYQLETLPLIFEITERIAIANTPIAQSVLSCLSRSGCEIAVDDFASPEGAFNLGSLDTLRPHYLKIDGWLAHQLPNPVAIARINAICMIAHASGIKVVLEQVESDKLTIVQNETEVDFVQGYAIARPEPLE